MELRTNRIVLFRHASYPQIWNGPFRQATSSGPLWHMRSIPGLTSTTGPLDVFLRSNPHAFARDELLTHWSQWALKTAVASGTARRILPGVYAAPEHTHHGQVLGEALNLWHPAGLVTGPLALHLYATELPMPELAHLHVTRGRSPRAPSWIHCHQGEALHRSSFPEGVRATSPARALLDAWRFAPAPERRNILWEALWAKVCTWREVKREVDRMYRISGRRDLERILGWFAQGAKSPLEVRAKYEVFTGARFRDFERQVELQLDGETATVDMLHRAAAVVVELDGDKYHSTRADRDADRRRHTLLVAAGYAVLRFGWRDIVDRPGWCRKQVLAVLVSELKPSSRSLRPNRT